MAALDLLAGLVEIGGDVVEVQLDRIGAGVLELAGEAGPAAGCGAVERGHDGDVEGLFQLGDLGEGGRGADGEDVGVGEERAGFGVGVDVVVEEPVGGELVGDELLLEQRVQHDCAGARVDEAACRGEVVAQG